MLILLDRYPAPQSFNHITFLKIILACDGVAHAFTLGVLNTGYVNCAYEKLL